MNPTELARKIMAIVADYDANTATTAIEISQLLVRHRTMAELGFNQEMINRKIGDPDKSQPG
jgi:hypothetical protein